MAREAIDIVLLPEQAMTDLAIAANAELVKNFGSKISLNKKDCLPHLSLAMGCIDSEKILPISLVLKPLVAIAPKRLKPAGIGKSTNLSGEIVSVVRVERSNSLQNLHERICEAVKPWRLSQSQLKVQWLPLFSILSSSLFHSNSFFLQ